MPLQNNVVLRNLATIFSIFRNLNKQREEIDPEERGQTHYSNPRRKYSGGRNLNDKTIVTAILERISIDCAAIPLMHVMVDEDDAFVSRIKSTLQECLSVQANIDQTGRQLLLS